MKSTLSNYLVFRGEIIVVLTLEFALISSAELFEKQSFLFWFCFKLLLYINYVISFKLVYYV